MGEARMIGDDGFPTSKDVLAASTHPLSSSTLY